MKRSWTGHESVASWWLYALFSNTELNWDESDIAIAATQAGWTFNCGPAAQLITQATHIFKGKEDEKGNRKRLRKGTERDWERENEQAMNQIEGRLEKWTCNMSHCLHVTWPAAPMRGTGWDKGKRAVMSNEMNQIEGRLARWTCNMSHLCLAATWPESKYEFKKTPERKKEMNQVHLQYELAATWPASKYKWDKKDLRKGKGDESDLARCTCNNMSHLCNLTSCCNILNQCFLPLSLLWAKQ